jgi:GNAT superfamily N-acetyltransferase
MSTRFFNTAAKVHAAFDNLFTGGSEHRHMMHSEASAAILKLACRYTDLSNFLAIHLCCPWSDFIVKNAIRLKDDLLTEYDGAWNRWKKEAAMEKNGYTPRVDFPRTTLAKTAYYRMVIEEESNLMESVNQFRRLVSCATVETVREHGRILAMQAARLISILIGMVDKAASNVVIQLLSDPIVCYIKQVAVCKANNKQKFEIINRLEANKIPYSSAGTLICNQTLYVISHIHNPDEYYGFAFVDCSVHTAAGEKTDARIIYVEINPSHRNMSLGRELIQWIKTTARDNGYTLLSSAPRISHATFWVKCGFKILEKEKIAVWNTNLMCIENIVN